MKSTYSCQTDFGAQDVGVTTTMVLPAKVKKGKKVPSKPVKLLVVIPEAPHDADALGRHHQPLGHGEGREGVGRHDQGRRQGRQVPRHQGARERRHEDQGRRHRERLQIKKPRQVHRVHPKKFNFTAKDQNGNPLLNNAPCTVVKGSPTKLGTLKVVK